MNEREMKVLKRIPKKYRKHIVSLKIEKTDYYNDRGQQIYYYTITYDNDQEVTFDNQAYMLFMLKEYDVDGYYVAP